MQHDPNDPSNGGQNPPGQSQSPYPSPIQPPAGPGYPHGQFGGYQMNPGYPEYGPKPHSGLGIASTILGVLAVLSMCAVFGLAGANYGEDPQAFERAIEQEAPEAMMIVLLCLGGGLIVIIGLVLGLIGLAQSTRNKTMAIIGSAINGLIVIGCCGLTALGAVMGA